MNFAENMEIIQKKGSNPPKFLKIENKDQSKNIKPQYFLLENRKIFFNEKKFLIELKK